MSVSKLEQRDIQLSGVRLCVTLAGAGQPVLLLHGFPDTHDVWRHQIPALVAAGYRVIVPDQRGRGASQMPDTVADYRLDHLVGDMLELLDALDIREPVQLIGHDWGAVVGWQLAIQHPQRFSSYAALSVGHPDEYRRGLEQKLRAWYVGFFQLRGLAEAMMRWRDWAMFRWFVKRHPECDAWIRALSPPRRLTAGLNWYRANAWALLTRRYAPTPASLPVLGIWSDGDFALAESQMKNSQRQVRGPWRYERITGASHWLQVDLPESTNRLLLDWLASHRQG